MIANNATFLALKSEKSGGGIKSPALPIFNLTAGVKKLIVCHYVLI